MDKTKDNKKSRQAFVNKLFPDLSSQYYEDDIQKNKVFALLPFFAFLLMPLFWNEVSKLIIRMSFFKFNLVYLWKPLLIILLIGIPFLVTYVKSKQSAFIRFYLDQGISFGIWGGLISAAAYILSSHVPNMVLVLFVVIIVAYYIFSLVFGIYNILKGKVRRNPIFGKKTYFKNN